MTEKARRVLVPLADGVEELEAVAVIDILRRAGCEVVTASIGAATLSGRSGIRITADRLLADVVGDEWDLIVVPGGAPGVARLRESRELREMIRSHTARGRETAAICAGPLVLADAGVLQGRRSACHASVEGELQGVRLVQLPVVEDGPVVTSRGPGTAVAFALRLVRRLFGSAHEEEIRRRIHA